MASGLDTVMKVASLLVPSAPEEKLIFRRFKGWALAEAASAGRDLSSSDVDTVILRVNPEQVQFTKRKVIQKVQTSAPGRFVVFDWGSELTVLNIAGNTGNLLPAEITNGTNPLFNTLASIVTQSGAIIGDQAASQVRSGIGSAQRTFGSFANNVQNTLMQTSTYFELLNMSPKYKTFKSLERMFDLADADQDVITLEFGDMAIYRGFFEEFSFEVVANTPWNWKYNITFIILANLTDALRRWDDQFNPKNTNIR